MLSQIIGMIPKLNKAIRNLDGLPNDGSDHGPFAECLYNLSRFKDSVDFMGSSLSDVKFEVNVAEQILEDMSKVSQEKLENPYKNIDLLSLMERKYHAYL